MIPLILYVGIFVAAFFMVRMASEGRGTKDYTSLKTVTFGDESAVRPNRAASIISVLSIFFMWATFTGSALIPSFLIKRHRCGTIFKRDVKECNPTRCIQFLLNSTFAAHHTSHP